MSFRRWAWAIAATVVAGCSQGHRTPAFRQITFEEDAASPALSRDGKLVAYCSRQGIWVREVDSDAPGRRLADGYDPAFSPDGAFVYFSSDRGVSRVPVAGGSAELVEPGAVAARFSPDGQFLLTDSSGGLRVQPGRTVSGNLTNCFGAVWAPDSRSILFAGGARGWMPGW